MIESWRKSFHNPDMAFLFVQLAPYQKPSATPTDHAWAHLRDSQLHTMLTLKNTGMAVITDVGEADIHPRKKGPVGARLALAARGIAYGDKIEYSGPIYKELKIDGEQAILSFTHVGKGLEARGESELKGFTIAGEDKVFYPAKAVIKGDQVAVSSDKVAKPVAVRFGWDIFPVVNLFNKDGLPASPFRTDPTGLEKPKTKAIND
jgi:sialate O-acetylesterase